MSSVNSLRSLLLLQRGGHRAGRCLQLGRPPGAIRIGGVVGQRLLMLFHNPDVADNQAIALSLRHTVGPGDGPHQRASLQRLVQIQTGRALLVEAGELYGANKHHPEGMSGILETPVVSCGCSSEYAGGSRGPAEALWLRRGGQAEAGRVGNISLWACKLSTKNRSVPVRRDTPVFLS